MKYFKIKIKLGYNMGIIVKMQRENNAAGCVFYNKIGIFIIG